MGKTKSFKNCCHNPTITYATENWRKHNSGKQPTVVFTLEPIQRSGVKHSVGKVIPHSNLGRQETPCKLFPHLDRSNSSGELRPQHGKSNSIVEEGGTSPNRQWIEFELTLYNIYSAHQHDVDDTTTRNSDQYKAWPPNTPGAQEADGGIQQLTLTPENYTQGLGEQMQNSNEVTQMCPQPHVNYQLINVSL